MAIDTAEKRRSAAYVGLKPLSRAPTPNSAKDAEWRAQVCWGYSGFAAGDDATPQRIRGFITNVGRLMSP
jgi:hypothetical protein